MLRRKQYVSYFFNLFMSIYLNIDIQRWILAVTALSLTSFYIVANREYLMKRQTVFSVSDIQHSIRYTVW